MGPKIIFLLNSIGTNKGGLTHASLRQASTFANAGYDTHILTFSHNRKFKQTCHKLVETGKVSEKVNIRNIFEEYSLYNKKDKLNTEVTKTKFPSAKTHSISKRKGYNAYRCYNNGVYDKYISLSEEDHLEFIDYFNENRYRIKREYYNLYGKIDRVQYFSYEENKVRQEIFYDKYHKAFLTIWYNPKTQKRSRILHFDSNNNIISETTSDDTLYKLNWLNNIINEDDVKNIVISDTRSTDKLLVHLDSNNTKTIIRLHSNHLKDSNIPNSKLNARNKYSIENIKHVDAIVVLTETQRQDIAKYFGYKEKIYVIPNYYEINLPKITGLPSYFNKLKYLNDLKKITRFPYKVVVISRFSKIKNIDHTIHAFRNVVSKIPEARLEIWGKGGEKDYYLQLIKENQLEKNVTVKGYTQNPAKVYRSAALSIVTSKSEGFSLSIMESMVNKTPVVSYDIRYGPSDMIENGVNGFLIKPNDIHALAEIIIYMLKNPQKTKRMGEIAGEIIVQKFNKKDYQNAWFALAQE